MDAPTNLPEHFQLFLYIGYGVVAAMAVAIGILWRALEERNKYIREHDKSTLNILGELSSALNNIQMEITRLPDDVSARINQRISDMLDKMQKK